jgi:anthranilate phosphoribosyltransferase
MGARTWPNLLSALLTGNELDAPDTAWAMGEIMAGNATPVQVAGLAMALRAKGETPGEIAGLVEAMLANATLVELPEDVRATAVDVVGTGGDRAHTVNISTMAAIIVAAAGVTVVKHGNRAASSACGTADLLEHFGIPLDLGPAGVARTVREAGIGFCFAARYHPGMRHAAVPRRELGVPTFFNMLGPLTNPASANAQLIGVYAAALTEPLARVLAELGTVRAFVVHGSDGLDEISNTGESRVSEVRDGMVRSYTLRPEDFGLPHASIGELMGGDREENARIIRAILDGEAGPRRDIVLMNAAAALVAGGKARDLKDGVGLAAHAIDSRAAVRTLQGLVALSRRLAEDR